MYQRILLAYDGSLEGRKALREGALLAHRCGAAVFLLSVIPKSAGVHMADGAHAGALDVWEDKYREIFEEGLSRMRALGFAPKAKLVSGDAAEEIAAYAWEVEADLVVVSHRRQSLLERWWSGPQGAYLSEHLHCSLLISRNDVSDAAFVEQVAGEGTVC